MACYHEEELAKLEEVRAELVKLRGDTAAALEKASLVVGDVNALCAAVAQKALEMAAEACGPAWRAAGAIRALDVAEIVRRGSAAHSLARLIPKGGLQ